MTTYLEYSKLILEKVSFDRHLFEKELRKAVHQLADTECKELKSWCMLNYSPVYLSIIVACFGSL